MAEYVVMQRGAETMHVPPHKVAAFLEAGWTEIRRVAIESEASPAVDAPTAPDAGAAPKAKPARGRKAADEED